jgi:branched-chain amino acid transport system ATP-binding protein
MLRIESLCGGYGLRQILHDINLHVDDGETVAVLGANTAGKTSLMRAIAGVLPKSTGEIDFGGGRIDQVVAHRRVERGVALVPEGRHIFPNMTVDENLQLGAFHRRSSITAADYEQCYAMFPRLKERRLQLAGTLSGGEQQMVAIGRALMARPKLLLLDEPSHGLAPLMVAEVHAAISAVNKLGLAVLLVEQNVASALKIVSRAYVLEAGRIALQGSTAELSANENIRRTYLGI